MISVAIYITNKQYGGPEEGGWWYDVGEPVPEHAEWTLYFERWASANRYAEGMNSLLCKKLNEGRHEPGSVLCEGWYQAIPMEGEPRAYPETRPHYE